MNMNCELVRILKDIGANCFQELVWHSLEQDLENYEKYYFG